jgi:hypothetical protein
VKYLGVTDGKIGILSRRVPFTKGDKLTAAKNEPPQKGKRKRKSESVPP